MMPLLPYQTPSGATMAPSGAEQTAMPLSAAVATNEAVEEMAEREAEQREEEQEHRDLAAAAQQPAPAEPPEGRG